MSGRVGPVGDMYMHEVEYWRTMLRHRLMDCSTVEYHNLSEAAVDNMALVAAQAVVQELKESSK